MSWFNRNNINAQAQLNSAMGLADEISRQKDAEISRLQNEANMAAARAASAGSGNSAATMRAKSRANDLEDEVHALQIEIATAKNAINQGLIEIEALKGLTESYGAKAGVSEKVLADELAERRKDARERLGFVDVEVPEARQKPVLVEYTDENREALYIAAGFIYDPLLKKWCSPPTPSPKPRTFPLEGSEPGK